MKGRIVGVVLWILAVAITLGSASWQRRTGPTYPVRGEVTLGGQPVPLKLTRTHGGPGGQPVRIEAPDTGVSGEVIWRRFPTSDPWKVLPFARNAGWLEAELPHQPPAGKLEYEVRLRRGDETATFPPRPAVTRFKGHVPAGFLIPHILAMFLGMMVANRAGLEALRGGNLRKLSFWTLHLLIVGGLILGPIVQKYAFGAFWTGVPFGWDLTDNKTLIAAAAWVLAWTLALLEVRHGHGRKMVRIAVLIASLITLAIFIIPHSTWGSQVDWSKVPRAAARLEHPAPYRGTAP